MLPLNAFISFTIVPISSVSLGIPFYVKKKNIEKNICLAKSDTQSYTKKFWQTKAAPFVVRSAL